MVTSHPQPCQCLRMLAQLWLDLFPRSPLSHCLHCSSYLCELPQCHPINKRTLKAVKQLLTNQPSLCPPTLPTSHGPQSAPPAASVFLCTTVLRHTLPLTMMYGTPILQRSAGKNMTSSISGLLRIDKRDAVIEPEFCKEQPCGILWGNGVSFSISNGITGRRTHLGTLVLILYIGSSSTC